MKNPIGNQQDEIARLKEKSAKMAKNINSHALSRTEAKLAYEAFYIPAMRYSLSVTSINQLDFETIQRTMTSSILSYLGYNRNMPREVVFGPQKFQGVGLRHLYDLQGADGTRLLLNKLNDSTSTTNKMLQILLDTIQQEAGIQRPILEDTRPLQYIEWGWIPSLRDFLHHIDATITNATKGLPIYREYDSLIMDSKHLRRANRKESILINRCRLALQVECVSDISTADGRHIDTAWLDPNTEKPSWSTKRWPRQGDPGPEAWSIWRKFLNDAFLQGNQKKLRQPLGKWIATNNSRMHRTYYSRKDRTLWKRFQDGNWSQHSLISSHRRSLIFDSHGSMTPRAPNDILPLDIAREGLDVIITGTPGHATATLRYSLPWHNAVG
jgi:hypothetical protein